MTKEEARAAIEAIRAALGNIEKRIIELIEGRGWIVLGYETFVDMWTAEFEGFMLTTDELKKHAVYAALSDERSDEEIITALGVGDRVVSRLREQRTSGVPVGLARVRAHDRALPSQADTLHIKYGPEKLARWKEACESRGLDPHVESAKALDAWLRRLERANARSA